MLAGLNLGYNENLKGDYQYSGAYSDSETVTEMYKNDIMFLSSDYLTVGGEVTYSALVSKNTSLFVKGALKYYAPVESDFNKRIYSNISFGITF